MSHRDIQSSRQDAAVKRPLRIEQGRDNLERYDALLPLIAHVEPQ